MNRHSEHGQMSVALAAIRPILVVVITAALSLASVAASVTLVFNAHLSP